MPDLSNLSEWSAVRVFLAVAETGSYSAAGRMLRLSQPTVGRQIESLEERLGAVLFTRHPRGMSLTEAGAQLMGPARDMERAAHALALSAAGQSSSLAGPVRITASVFIAHHVLPGILARLREELPEVTLDLVASDAVENLLFREADIAVRMFRPDQLDIVTRHLGDLSIGLYGAVSYLDRRGRPSTRDELMRHDFVGFDRNDMIIRGLREQGFDVTRDFFSTRCDAQAVYWELVRAGCGLGFGQTLAGDRDPQVERVMPELPSPFVPVWLAAHESMRRTPRVRRVWDALAEALSTVVS